MRKPDLFIKERLPGGGYSDPVPAFGRGKTTEEKLADAEAETKMLNESMQELTDLVLMLLGEGME